jgi:hypothetical protein
MNILYIPYLRTNVLQFLHVHDLAALSQTNKSLCELPRVVLDERVYKIGRFMFLNHETVLQFLRGGYVPRMRNIDSVCSTELNTIVNVFVSYIRDHVYDLDAIADVCIQRTNLMYCYPIFHHFMVCSLLYRPVLWYRTFIDEYYGFLEYLDVDQNIHFIEDRFYIYKLFHHILSYMYLYDIKRHTFVSVCDVEAFVTDKTLLLLTDHPENPMNDETMTLEELKDCMLQAFSDFDMNTCTTVSRLRGLERSVQWKSILVVQDLILEICAENDPHEGLSRDSQKDVKRIHTSFCSMDLFDDGLRGHPRTLFFELKKK